MNGADTIKAIDTAYGEIVARKAEKLIIDLRRNGGGAFAVVPLIGHLIDKPIDAGVFVVGSWYADHQKPPGPADFPSATPWRGYSVRAFQADVLTRPLTSYRIDPMKPLFQGPVFVLTSARSISAAEIAADALKSIGRATIVGEKTPGVVLSSKLFDIPGGFHLRVPIADYYSIKNGRLEGVGVTPDIPSAPIRRWTSPLGCSYLAGREPTYRTARSIQASSAVSMAFSARTQTNPLIGRPVMSMGLAPGRARASASSALPTRNMNRPTSTPHNMFPLSIQQ